MDNNKLLMVGKMYALGFRERHDGTAMLRTAVELYEPGMYLTKQLYPAVAKRHGTTPQAAERAMRYALHHRGCAVSEADAQQFFGAEEPTLTDFIGRMAAYLEYGV